MMLKAAPTKEKSKITSIWSYPLLVRIHAFIHAVEFFRGDTPLSLLHQYWFLELSYLESTITAQNYTKPTAENSFLHLSSCHHLRWVKNVPKSKFCHLRHNCTRLEDYNTQSVSLKQELVGKGYPPDLIDQAHLCYNTEDVPEPKSRIKDNVGVKFITQYHTKHWRMESVFKRHWSMLQQDPHLKTTISTVPQFAYRKEPNIKEKVAHQ